MDDEVGNHAPIIGVHARAIGIEDPHDLYVELVLPMVVEKEGLGAALSFIVARARADRVDIAPIALGLRMDRRISVNL